MAKQKMCSIVGCGNPALTRGWCSSHYRRWIRHRDPLAGNASHGAARQWILDHLAYKGRDCLIWPFATLANGYGVVRIRMGQKSLQIASRIMCELTHGKPPKKWYEAAHTCGAGHAGCVNLRHLAWMTPRDNRADKIKHRTYVRGEDDPRSKLTDAKVRKIRALTDSVPQSVLAKRFGVSQGHISRIINGRDWYWVK
jgi:hypothetical protein